jgi:V/A-type H+-transporting ATPase subunit D
MAIEFQYNKTSLQGLEKQLKVRERALPTLKNKESALRIEVKKAKDMAEELDDKLAQRMAQFDNMSRLWGEFDMDLVSIKDVHLTFKKLAGVMTPVLESVDYEIKEFSLFDAPLWTLDGVEMIKELAQIAIEREIFVSKMERLDYARKKTTQKVNLYEKVQIPGYNDAVRKIKRFLEDEENLSKSAQKIVKSKKEKEGMQ